MVNIEAQCEPFKDGAMVRFHFDDGILWRRDYVWIMTYDWFSIHLKVPNEW